MTTQWGKGSSKKDPEFVALSDDVQKLLKTFKVTGGRFKMTKAEFSDWEAKLLKHDLTATRKTAIELMAVEENFKATNKEGTVDARAQLESLVDALVVKLRAGKGWSKKKK